jgi:Xaa-Pro aminopeptidase
MAAAWLTTCCTVQAEEQLDDNWTLHRVGEPGVLDWSDWLVEQAEDKALTLGLDARLSSYSE